MKVGLVLTNFTIPGGPDSIGTYVKSMARAADDCGYFSLWMLDHFFQPGSGELLEGYILEAYSALAFAAAVTRRVRLGTMVTGVTYRHPGILAKTVATLDVLSRGRAYLGIGAAWSEQEHLALGVRFPPGKERFEILEETLQICLQMWAGEVKPFDGKHHRLAAAIDTSPPLSRPHPPILVGGSGEKKTLLLVAKYADACNIGGSNLELLKHKLQVLRDHCDAVGRNYDDIDKTSIIFEFSLEGGTSRLMNTIRDLREAGIQHVILSDRGATDICDVELIARDVLPQVAEW